MKYNFKGSFEVRFPEGKEFTASGDTKEDALVNLVQELIENGNLIEMVKMDYLTASTVRKVFKVKVTQTFINEVEIDTEEYSNIEDETDAQRYVHNHLYDFAFDFDYNDYSLDDTTVECDSWDTREETFEV